MIQLRIIVSKDINAYLDGILSNKGLVADYASDVSSEDFSAPEDGECESDGGGANTKAKKTISKPDLRPAIIAHTSPIFDNEMEDDFGSGENKLNPQNANQA